MFCPGIFGDCSELPCADAALVQVLVLIKAGFATFAKFPSRGVILGGWRRVLCRILVSGRVAAAIVAAAVRTARSSGQKRKGIRQVSKRTAVIYVRVGREIWARRHPKYEAYKASTVSLHPTRIHQPQRIPQHIRIPIPALRIR